MHEKVETETVACPLANSFRLQNKLIVYWASRLAQRSFGAATRKRDYDSSWPAGGLLEVVED